MERGSRRWRGKGEKRKRETIQRKKRIESAVEEKDTESSARGR